MEKKRPHYPLSLIHDLAHYPEKVRYTDSAVKGAHQLGLTTAGIRNVVINLQPKDFYKSMTTYADPSIWQDVYHPKISGSLST